MAKAVIDQDRCKGCGLCTDACPKKILAIAEKLNKKGYHPVECTDTEKCIGCGFCYRMCPDCAIRIEQ